MLNPEPRYSLGPGISPLRYFYVRLDKGQFSQFERQMRQFGAAFGFEDKSKKGGPDDYDVVFYMQRSDVDLIGSNDTPKAPANLTYSIGFYPKRNRPPPPAANVNVLVEGLKQLLAPVKGAVMTESKSEEG